MSRPNRALEYSFFIIVGVLALLAIARVFSDWVWEDARVYLRAGARFVEGTAMYRDSDGTMPFKYAPPIALLFAPYSLLPLAAGCLAWNVTSVLVFASAGRRWLEWLGIQRPAELWLATLALATSFHYELHFGQSDLLLLGLATSSFAAAISARPIRSGAFFALMVLVKPPTLVMLVPLALFGSRRHLIALSGLATLVALTSGVALRYGAAGALEQFAQWRNVLATTSPPWVLGHDTQSLVAVTIELLGLPAPKTMGETLVPQVIATAVVAAALFRLRRSRFEFVSGCLLASALLSPLAWRANFVLGWPALLSVVARRGVAARFLVGVALVGQIVFIDGVLSIATNRAVLMWRPFAWFAVAVLAVLVSPNGPVTPATVRPRAPAWP